MRLLLVSDINANGAVGKWYTIHNYHWFSGILPEDTMIYAGPAAGGWAIDDFNTTFHEYSDGSFLMGTPIMYFAGDTQPIEGVKNMPPGTPMWGSRFQGIPAHQLPPPLRHVLPDRHPAAGDELPRSRPDGEGSLGAAGPAHHP